MALADNLISFWQLEEASGTRIDAVTATGNDLTDNNTVTNNPGVVGNAAQFTLINSEYLSRADNASLSMGNIDCTFAQWVYLDSKLTTLGLTCKYITTGDQREYALVYAPAAPVADRFNWRVNATGMAGVDTVVSATSFGSPSLATWYFIVADHNAAADTISIQVNNGTIDSAAHTTGIFNGTAEFQLGAFSTSFFHNGRMDQVGIWKRLLTAQERTFLYNGGAGRSYAEVVGGPGMLLGGDRNYLVR